MCRIRIGTKDNTRSIEVRIKDPADARQIMVIMAKNGYPVTLHGDHGKEEQTWD